MLYSVTLNGNWRLQLDEEKKGIELRNWDIIELPGTTSYAKKGKKNEKVELGFLTDEYAFEGYAWYEREITIEEDLSHKICYLYLERTRKTKLYIDNIYIGSNDSLCTPHVYEVGRYLSVGLHTIRIQVDNTDYKTRGGHMTSPDTQTNWNGIIGRLELQIYNKDYIKDIKTYPNIIDKSVRLEVHLSRGNRGKLIVQGEAYNSDRSHQVKEQSFIIEEDSCVELLLGEGALLWSEFTPNLYKLICTYEVEGKVVDTREVIFGMREFRPIGDKFAINGHKTFLRGKHDGLLFPLTGFSPTTVEEWLTILSISKSYGINHYRYHTACPPKAAFIAADLLGMYFEPELPFWGTVTEEGEDNHNALEQEYLIKEGFRILDEFGNHPSFVMMSLGNELWGSAKILNKILKSYKEYDNRHLYTQGSNNFQFVPTILEEEDFFCGVRFSRERLFRGSYAMCDAPLGHVQTDMPSTMKDYNNVIKPEVIMVEKDVEGEDVFEIQYGTGVKRVAASHTTKELVPSIPVISHEIGQYAIYPNFKEIDKYKNSLKAKNFTVFYERLKEKGMEELADKFFYCSGKLSVSCYKEELEAQFRTKNIAGFQLLDLQDFSGQGTALVGILDAFMDSKGLISSEEWKTFCSDAVLLARFERYNYLSEEEFYANLELSYYGSKPLNEIILTWELKVDDKVYDKNCIKINLEQGDTYYSLGDIKLKLPKVYSMKKMNLSLTIDNSTIYKSYDLWIYPLLEELELGELYLCDRLDDNALSKLEEGRKVVLCTDNIKPEHSIEGTYCTDFWCYPMFRSISESMNKKTPIGTMGLVINKEHKIFEDFLCEEYSTYPWWTIVMNSRSIILDALNNELNPMVRVIDNFERNHKLGLLFECNVLNGKLIVCSANYEKLSNTIEGRTFLSSIFTYANSSDFKPTTKLELEELKQLL